MLIDRIAALRADLDSLLAEDLVGVARDELLELVRRLEGFKRRLSVVDHRLVGEVDDRHVAGELCMTGTSVVLQRLLRLTPGEAAGRVRAARDLGPRRSLLGEVLPPLFGRVAAAQAAGLLSAGQARVIVATVDKIPAAIQAECEAQVEAELVVLAESLDALSLAKAGKHVLAYLDPDGTLTDDSDHDRRREVLLVKHRDGSAQARSYLAPDLTAMIEAFLDVHAAPTPAADGSRDLRPPGQRNYDAVHAGFTHLLGCGPATPAGKPAKPAGTLVLTMTASQFQSGPGYVSTPHGDLITVPTALKLVDGGKTMSVLFDPSGGLMSYGRSKRLVPPDMRLALTARDRGCSFPGCTRPAAWTEAHHFREWANGGDTSIDNCGLGCSWHHRNFAQRGWRSEIINSRPNWRPPKWIDPTQVPRRNTVHDPPRRT